MLQRILSKMFGKKPGFNFHYSGEFSSWEQVKDKAKGYDAQEVYERTCEAAMQVKKGNAAFERDSVLFEKHQFSWPIASIIQHHAILKGRRLNVLDFGGSLGSTYFQHKLFFGELESLKWKVVELPKIVKFGKENLQNGVLTFYNDIEEADQDGLADIFFSSSTLQYLPDPLNFLKEICSRDYPVLLFDRIAFVKHDREILTLQITEEKIYKASYPAWFFNEYNFIDKIESMGYTLKNSFDSYCDKEMTTKNQKVVYWKGFYFCKKNE